MTREAFQRLRLRGRLGGGFIVLLGIIAMYSTQSAWYFVAAYFLFWLVNYVVIHHYVATYLLKEQLETPKTKTLIDPV